MDVVESGVVALAGEMSWRPVGDTTLHCIVDLSLLFSCREPRSRSRGWPYARALRGGDVHTEVVVTGPRYG
jgi:hypothetical protein